MNTPSTYAPGDFSFISSVNERAMLTDAYQAVSSTDTWVIMKNDPGFMFTKDALLTSVGKAMKYTGHSGASYGWTISCMHRIAILGWDLYVFEYLRTL